MEYHGPERRQEYFTVVADLAVLKQQIHTMVERQETMHEENQLFIRKYGMILDGDGGDGLLTRMSLQMKTTTDLMGKLNDHIRMDRWLFGVTMTLILFLAGKVILGHL